MLTAPLFASRISAAHDTGGGEAKGWIWRVVKFCVMQFYEVSGMCKVQGGSYTASSTLIHPSDARR